MTARKDTLRVGGRRGLLGGHHGKEWDDIEIGFDRRRFRVLRRIIHREMKEEAKKREKIFNPFYRFFIVEMTRREIRNRREA
mgnify:CR=1 FL=1